MENKNRFNHLNEYLKNKFGERTLKICIDGGFACPNRDGTLSKNGCIFCSNKGSGEHIKSESNISEQVKRYFESYKATRANKFIAYFQNFTNTYDSIENLKKKYNSALIDERIVGLSVATRPDCINEGIVNLLKSYTNRYYVCVELGLQTSNEEIGDLINRKYSNKDFSNAVTLLNKYNIEVIAHVMVGLPNETFEDLKNTIKYINKHNIKGLKIHCTYIVKNTKLADMYLSGAYTPISLEYYLNSVTYILTHINPEIIIHRVSGDSPKDLLIAPEWNLHKKWILNGLDKFMRQQDLWQGKFYDKSE